MFDKPGDSRFRLLARHAGEAVHFVGDCEPRLRSIAKQRHRGVEPAGIIQRSAHDQSHARETFSFNHHYGPATGAEFAIQLASAIASIREGLEPTLHGKGFIRYRHHLYEDRPGLLLTIPALAYRGYYRITRRRVPEIPAKASSIHIGHSYSSLMTSRCGYLAVGRHSHQANRTVAKLQSSFAGAALTCTKL
jgi:hypothetical protein